MQISNHDADDVAEDECLHHHGHECEGHAEDGQQQVADGQVEQVHVGDGSHLFVPHKCQDHQTVSRNRQEEDNRIWNGQESGYFVRVLHFTDAR